MTAPVAYIDGQWVDAAQATVPVIDAGYVQGITVTEHLRTFRGKLFALDAHWARLERSLSALGITPREPLYELSYAAEQTAKHNYTLLEPGDDLGLLIIVSPGSYGAFSRVETYGPRVVIHTYPLPFARWSDSYRTGVSLRIAPQTQVPATSWPRAIKARSRLHYYLADRWATGIQPGARALLLDEAGRINETSTANVVAVFKNELVSPPREAILPGISLDYVAQLAEQAGYLFVERHLSPEQFAAADEILLTSTPFCLLPVTQLDGHTIGTAKPGPVFGELLNRWSQAVGVEIAGQARRAALLSRG